MRASPFPLFTLLFFAPAFLVPFGCGSKPLVRPSPGSPNGIAQLERTLRDDPDRLDLRLQLARLYQDQDDFEPEYALWVKTLQLADQASHHYRWEDGPTPPQRPSRLICADLQVSIDHYLGHDNEEGTARALRLSKLGLTYFPNRRSFERSRAVCYSRRGDPKAAVHCLLRLLARDPGDPATLRTMGDVLEEAGKEKEAGIYFEKAARLSGEDREGVERNGAILTY